VRRRAAARGNSLEKSTFRLLIVDDYQPWRSFVRSTLQKEPSLQIVGEVSDGLEAVQKAKELQPDLILLDIGLPTLNGIEVARQIRKLSLKTKMLILSQESSPDLVQELLNAGAEGYVVKTDAGSELLPAVKSLLRGGTFLGNRFKGAGVRVRAHELVRQQPTINICPKKKMAQGHAAGFYYDDSGLLDNFTEFIAAALPAGNSAIVVATESHRDCLLPRLQASGVDIGAAIEQGRFLTLDAGQAVSTFMVNDLPDPTRFLEIAHDLITRAAESAFGNDPRVAICGECDPPLCMIGNGEAAIRLEQLWNVIAARYSVDILCGYSLSGFYDEQSTLLFERICAEHSAVYSR
jgi:CheY-like chemotaxis protein